MSSPIHLQRLIDPHLASIAALLPSNYKLTLVARHVGPLDADLILTNEAVLPKAADAIHKLYARSVADGTKNEVERGEAAYMIDLSEQAKRLLPDGFAFVLVTIANGDGPRPVRYIANCERGDAVNLLREFCTIFEAKSEDPAKPQS